MITLRIQAHEAVGGSPGTFKVEVLVTGKDQIKLGLFGITAEWIIGFQGIQVLFGFVEVARVHGLAGILVIGLFRQDFHLLLGRTAGGQRKKCGK